MVQPTPFLNLSRHFDSAQLRSAPAGSSSLAISSIHVDGGKLVNLASHMVTRASLVVDVASRGVTDFRKLFFDLRWLQARM